MERSEELLAPSGKDLGMEPDAAAVIASTTAPERFGAVFDRHHRQVWNYIARLAGREAADELAGEVFTAAFAQRDQFDPDRGHVRPWLLGIATNLVRSRLGSESRARHAYSRAGAAEAAEVDPTLLVDDAAALAWNIGRVRAAIAQLDADQRVLLALYAWEELSYAEIAEALDIPIGTVRSRLARTRARLRELVAPLPAPDPEAV